MRVLALSPHLDDAVFSAGGTLARLGAAVTLVTAFTASVPEPRGFALACQTDKGLGPEVDYLALRREEDRRATAVLGLAEAVHVALPEAPHRGYGSAAELFGALRDDDGAAPALREALAGLEPADLVLVPQGLGDHVDHRQLRRALGLPGRADDPPPLAPLALGPVAAWRDAPYALRRGAGAGREDVLVALAPDALARKLDACAAYASQLGFQFGGEAGMRAALGAVRAEGFAAGDAARAALLAAGAALPPSRG